MNEYIVDMSDPHAKAVVLAALRGLQGRHRIEVKRYRARRTDAQNRLLWAAINAPFGDFLREQGESYTDEDAHCLLKQKFLRETIVNKDTGEVIGERLRSTTELNTAEFSEYVEKCAAYLADMFGVVVHLPGDVLAGVPA
jgi:hypothetical protein